MGDSDDDDDGGNITVNDGGRSLLTKLPVGSSLKGCKSEFVVRHVGKNFGSEGEGFDTENVSGISFESHPSIVESFSSANRRYFLEPSDANIWPARYPTTPLISVDLLPTGNIIEEIFGSCTNNSKLSDEKSIS
ncbi:hypothetical protein U1Q18_016765 [Sarracenia purpurea var. burkii]